ncbi:MAG TPA: 8-amino-7-oxononanoate synthase [Methylomirabilota bacterium]|nr:8-amino-7-oxononanoate synthase [Methylomirabilota bacterium]
MNFFENELNQRLNALRGKNLFRELRRVDSPQSPRIQIGGQTFLNFSSNDYLGLANDPILKEGAIRAIKKFGAGAGASRLICGSLAPFHELEEALADFKQTEAALTFSTGYAAAIGTICALLSKDDIIILDKLVHASIVDAARLGGAKLRVFDHNDLNDLEKILKWTDKSAKAESGKRKAEILIVTESIFSMDGDDAPLREIAGLKNKYGAWLMVDEAHATGLFGKNRRGLAEELEVSGQIEIQMGTLGKALGASGGYICGSRALIDFLVNRARSFIFSTAPVPAAAAAATAGIRFVQSNQGKARCNSLWQRAKQFNSKFKIQNSKLQSTIIPILIGDENKAVEAAAKLREQNIFIPAIRFPTVARGAARLRVTLTAAHSAKDVSELIRALKTLDIGL